MILALYEIVHFLSVFQYKIDLMGCIVFYRATQWVRQYFSEHSG